jgi:putative oxidoreductase
MTTPCSRSTLLHQRGSALADFLKRRFEATKLLRAEFREHSLHLPGMLSEGRNNEVLAPQGEGDNPNAPVFGTLDPADEALRDETVHGNADGTWGQIDDWTYHIDGQRPFVQQDFQHAEIREAEPGLFNTSGCIPREGAHRLHHYQPNVVRPLRASRHKNLNLPEVYIINSIEFNMIDAMEWLPIQKENPAMRTASTIARYLAGVIFLVFGLNGFLNFIPLPPPGGIAGQFMGALYASHYLWVIFAFQVIAAVLLLANRYVPLAVAVLAPVIVNILVFHALMAPSGLPLALFVAVLWAVIFVGVRPAFDGLFQSRSKPQA